MGQVLIFTSGKGGVGKTTIAANVAFCLAMKNRKVALVDLDLGLRNLDLVMGLENKVVYHLGDVLSGTCRLKQALIKDFRCMNLSFLPGIINDNKADLNGLYDIIQQLKKDYDYVVLDSPAGLESGFQFGVLSADQVYLVVNPEICSIRDAFHVKEHILLHHHLPIRLIVNRTRKNALLSKHFFTTQDIEEMLSIESFGEIPNDEQIVYFINKGDLLMDKRLSVSRAIERIGSKIIEMDGEMQLC